MLAGEKLESVLADVRTSTDMPTGQTELEPEHTRVIGLLTAVGGCEYKDGRVTTHTATLKRLHADPDNKIKGDFDTIATGKDGPSDRNCFMCPKKGGGWLVFRFGNAKEDESWETSKNGNTYTTFNEKTKKSKPDPVAQIVRLATANDSFFHTADGRAYVTTEIGGHQETVPVRSEAYRQRLRLLYTAETDTVAKREWITTAIEQLEAIAMRDRPEHLVHLRVAGDDKRTYLDLGNSQRQVVEITASGWEVKQSCSEKFYRPPSMLPLAMPERGGAAIELRKFVNISDSDWPLFLAALAMMLNPRGPYPLIALSGRGGVAKSTTARNVQSLIDATVIDGSSDIGSDEDLLIVAQQSWLLWFDNLSVINPRMSDSLCRLSTGGSHTRRKKYTDGDTSVFKAKRPVVITSVNDICKQPDLLDRTLRFECPPIVERKTEAALNAEFEKARGQILGVLLDGVSSALRRLSTTKVDKLPRLADFGLWATAAEEGLQLPSGSVMRAYWQNRSDTAALILDNDLARAIISLAPQGFSGTGKELATKIGWDADSDDIQKMLGDLRYMAVAFEEQGISVAVGKRSNKGRLVTIGKADK